ncbi:hypothetical protein [Natronorubrum halophilum]
MSSKNSVSKVVSVDEQAYEQEQARDEHEDVVDETPTFQATVEMEIQAKVDANHPDGIVDTNDNRIYGATLAQEERIRAREEELERISAQAEFGQQQGRAKRAREIAAKQSAERRDRFQKRAASVDPMADPERPDPRTELTQEELAAVNEQSMRLTEQLNGYSQRWMGEISYSTTKRLLGDAMRALGWYRQFREIVLMFAIINIEKLCEPL